MAASVTCELTIDDLIALSDDQMKHSAAMRRQFRTVRFICLLVGLLGSVAILSVVREAYQVIGLILVGAFVVLMPLLTWRAMHSGRRNMVRKLIGEGKNLSLIGRHTLTLHATHLATARSYLATSRAESPALSGPPPWSDGENPS